MSEREITRVNSTYESDDQWLAAQWAKHNGWLYALGRSALGIPAAETAELVSETMEQLAHDVSDRRKRELEDRVSVRGWLQETLVHLVNDEHRAWKRRPDRQPEDGSDEETDRDPSDTARFIGAADASSAASAPVPALEEDLLRRARVAMDQADDVLIALDEHRRMLAIYMLHIVADLDWDRIQGLFKAELRARRRSPDGLIALCADEVAQAINLSALPEPKLSRRFYLDVPLGEPPVLLAIDDLLDPLSLLSEADLKAFVDRLNAEHNGDTLTVRLGRFIGGVLSPLADAYIAAALGEHSADELMEEPLEIAGRIWTLHAVEQVELQAVVDGLDVEEHELASDLLRIAAKLSNRRRLTMSAPGPLSLFHEFVDAYERGEVPNPRAFEDRAGGAAQALMMMLSDYFVRAPVPELTFDAMERVKSEPDFGGLSQK